MIKPSQRINVLIGPTRSDPEYQERAVESIIEYLDEQQKGAPMFANLKKYEKVLVAISGLSLLTLVVLWVLTKVSKKDIFNTEQPDPADYPQQRAS